jgi:hypothetical protein
MACRRWLIPVLLTFTALAITGCGDSGDSNSSTVRVKVVPGVTGKPVAEARAAIIDAGLEALVQKGPSKKRAGTVVHQGDPAGSTVPEHTQITLYVSSGPEKPAPKSAAAPTPAAAPPPQQKSGGWTGVNADNYRLAKALCRAYPKEEIARQFKLPPPANEFTIAEKFAAALFSPDFQAPVVEGCLAGFGG